MIKAHYLYLGFIIPTALRTTCLLPTTLLINKADQVALTSKVHKSQIGQFGMLLRIDFRAVQSSFIPPCIGCTPLKCYTMGGHQEDIELLL